MCEAVTAARGVIFSSVVSAAQFQKTWTSSLQVPEIETSLHVISKLHVQAKEIGKARELQFPVYKISTSFTILPYRYDNCFELFRPT